MNDIDLFSTFLSVHYKDSPLYVFQLHFRQKAVKNILINRIPSWSGKLIHDVKNLNTFICTMIKNRFNAFQLRQNVSVSLTDYH